MSGRYQETRAKTPQEMLAEYQSKTERFSHGWQAQLALHLSQFADGLEHPPVNNSTRSQVGHLNISSQAQFSLAERYLYHCLRQAKHLDSDTTDKTGAHPQGLSDQRLIIEICLFMNDTTNAQVVIEHCPAVMLVHE